MHIASWATSMIRPATARCARTTGRLRGLRDQRHCRRPCRPSAWPEAERDHHRHAGTGKRQDAGIDFERELDRRNHDRKLLERQRRRPTRQQQAEEPGHDRQHHAFSRRLPDEAPGPTAERQANDELPPPALRSREHQVGEVCARHEEDEGRDRRQNHQRAGRSARARVHSRSWPSAVRRRTLRSPATSGWPSPSASAFSATNLW